MPLQTNIYNYFQRNPALRILFIFDNLDTMAELNNATWDEGYRYILFDGAWFTTKYRLEHEYKDDKVILRLLKPNPLRNDSQQQPFPLMDLLRANTYYIEDSDEQFMQQHSLPNTPEVCKFVHRHITELQMVKHQTILKDYLNPTSFSIDVARRGLISGYLGASVLLSWEDIFVELMIQCASDERKSNTFFNLIRNQNDILDALQEKALAIFGQYYNVNAPERMREIAESLKYNALTQLLVVVPNDNYKRYKVTNTASHEQMNRILSHVHNLPQAKCRAFEQAFQQLSDRVSIDYIVATYGIYADYFFVPQGLCYAIIKHLLQDSLITSPSKVLERLNLLAIKQENNAAVLSVIKFVQMMASFYDLQKSLGSLILNSPQEYIDRYTEQYYLLDYYYRKSLEYLPHDQQVPIRQEIDAAKDRLDKDYATITNNINVQWTKCLLEKGNGFESITLPRQYNFFNEQIDNSVKQVVIICDALRYEVAHELMQELGQEKHVATLTAGLAILPTETKFCKPTMFPHNDMYICTNQTGDDSHLDMSVENHILNSLDKRRQYLQSKVPNSDCINAKVLLDGNTMDLRELFKKSLVYVYYDVLDTIGHEGDRVSVTDVCNRAVTDIAKMVKTLHASLNVSNVIITADHGFIYNDKAFDLHEKIQVPADSMERTQRYYITPSPDPIHGVAKLPLSKVSGVSNVEYVAVPMGTNRFSEQGGGYEFTHGGASLQELIIPIIKSQVRRTNSKTPVGVFLVTRPNDMKVESSRIRFKLCQKDSVSMENRARTIRVALYDGENIVSDVKQYDLNSTSSDANLREIAVDLLLTKQAGSILQMRVYDIDDNLNPLVYATVINNTLIEQDF